MSPICSRIVTSLLLLFLLCSCWRKAYPRKTLSDICGLGCVKEIRCYYLFTLKSQISCIRKHTTQILYFSFISRILFSFCQNVFKETHFGTYWWDHCVITVQLLMALFCLSYVLIWRNRIHRVRAHYSIFPIEFLPDLLMNFCSLNSWNITRIIKKIANSHSYQRDENNNLS